MILGALVACVLLQGGQVIELPDPTVDSVSIQAVVKLPELSIRQRSLLRVVANSLAEDTATFSRAQMSEVAARVGSRMRVTLMEDHLRLSFDVLAPDIKNGLSMVASVLREPALTDDVLKQASEDLQFRRVDYWRQTLLGVQFEMPRYNRRDLDELRALVLRPENVTLGVAGKFEPGEAAQQWAELESRWQAGRIPRPSGEAIPSRALNKIDGTESVFELRGPEIRPRDADFPTKLLAVFALGTGKGGSLFKIAREKLGWSYRQESVLWPTPGGLAPRLLVAQSASDEIDKRAETLRTELLEEIKNWTEQDRKRAIGMAEGALVRGLEVSPLYFLPDRPVTTTGADQAFLAAYWKMKTGEVWNPQRLLASMSLVTVDDLKGTAQEMLASSIARVYLARR